MQYKDLLRGTVLLVAAVATALGVISAIALNAEGDDALAALALGWWVIAFVVGIWLGRADRTAAALRDVLATARTATSLPSETPAAIAFARLWPIVVFAAIAAGLGVLFPQVPAIATGMAVLFALAWRRREAAVTAIEERDGVCFYVERTGPLEPVKLVRTPGLMRGGAART